MMITFETVLTRVGGLEGAELSRWIENRWVLPDSRADTFQFREVDLARVRLIHEMRRDFGLDDDALELVLSLLDQVYGLRRQLRVLCTAVGSQPEPVRKAILAQMESARDHDED